MATPRTADCPSCGATHRLQHPAVAQVTCDYCSSIFLLDPDGVRDTGIKARLFPAISGLAVGARGSLKGVPFRVVGRVQYAYGLDSARLDADAGASGGGSGAADGLEIKGKWDEWFIELDGRRAGRLSEDMGRFSLDAMLDERTFTPPKIEVGVRFDFRGDTFVLRDTGEARAVGCEGELPMRILPNDGYSYADATDLKGERLLSMELRPDTEAMHFYGTRLEQGDIDFDRAAPAQRTDGVAFNCPDCGGPCDPQGESRAVLTLTCPFCNSELDISRGMAIAVGRVDPELAKVFLLKLGDSGTFRGRRRTVTGRMRYEWQQGSYRGYNLEYLLYSEEDGYGWLAQSQEGAFAYGHPVDEAPEQNLNQGYSGGDRVRIGSREYRFLEHGRLVLRYVDGALPWRARVGESGSYAEAEAPPFLYTEEISEVAPGCREIEYFLSARLASEEVRDAFGIG